MAEKDDLRERLEAAELWCREMSRWQYLPPREQRKIAKHAATLREVLAHPERLMVPVDIAYVQPTDAWFRRVVVESGVWPKPDENNVPYGLVQAVQKYHRAMYAAKPAGEVKPRAAN